jgi:hypothetical protein
MKIHHLPSLQNWSVSVGRLGRRLYGPFQHWRAKLPAWKVKR